MKQQEQTNGRGRAKGLGKAKNQNKYGEGEELIKRMSVCTCIIFSVLCYSSEINAKIFLFKNITMSILSRIRGLFSKLSASLFQPESDT